VLLKVYDDSIAAGGTIQESVQYGVYAIYSSGSACITETTVKRTHASKGRKGHTICTPDC
jgi:hypothetical protein